MIVRQNGPQFDLFETETRTTVAGESVEVFRDPETVSEDLLQIRITDLQAQLATVQAKLDAIAAFKASAEYRPVDVSEEDQITEG